ncbi:MAG: NFACT RNA binding domain-containing protein [Candidatus Poribacteria bacterium]|nr:NFACT RNA binding domain-containing protein [Candidatus Poribacteria bacterium]
MAIDSLALYCMLPHWREMLRNRPLRDVAQTSSTEVALRFRRDENEEFDPCLLLSAHTAHARAHLIERFPKVKDRSHFADVLFKHLSRADLVEIEQVGLDRILRLRFAPQPGIMREDAGDRLLIAEMMGKHSNLILVNAESNKIIDAIRHVDESVNRYREILPGCAYVPPPESDRLNPFELTRDEFLSAVDPSREKSAWKQILDTVDGFNPAMAKEVVARAVEPTDAASLWESFSAMTAQIKERAVEPCVVYQSDAPDAKALSYRLSLHVDEPFAFVRRTDTVNDAVADYHERAERIEQLDAMRNRLSQALDRHEKGVLRKRDALVVDRHIAEKADEYRIFGELLKSSLHLVTERAESVRVPNYYAQDTPEIDIPLDPSKSPVENAEAYFKKYRKAKRGAALIAQRLSDTEQELGWVAEYREKLTQAGTIRALETLHGELVQQGWIEEKGKRQRDRVSDPYRTFTVGDWRLLVGRNDRENEWLVTRVAKKTDMWLHAKQIPGSHVLIRNPEKRDQIPMPVMLKAAQLAAHYSKAKHSTHVPVDYTWIKYVIRPKGTAAGFVTYTREKTLYVEPEPPSALFGGGLTVRSRRAPHSTPSPPHTLASGDARTPASRWWIVFR